MIYHVTTAADWKEAAESGEYRVSTRGLSLDQVGFIHCASRDQVDGVVERFYGGVPSLILLTIDEGRLRWPLRFEAAAGSDEKFPHIHGPLNLDAVVHVESL